MRITIVCPEALISDANQLAMVLGLTVSDVNTYGTPTYQDGDSALYSAASFLASQVWIDKAKSPLVRPRWDEDSIIDMVAAKRAQQVLIISETTITAQPDKIAACLGDDGLAVLTSMGLTAYQDDRMEADRL